MNVFSHLVPAIYFTMHFLSSMSGSADYAIFQTWQSRAFMGFSAIACSYDMWSSVAYHLFNTMGESFGESLLKYDLAGIVAVMLAFFIALSYTLFFEWSWERSIIMGVLTPTIISNFFVLFHPACRKDSMHCYKVFVISTTQVLLFLTAVIGRLYLCNEWQE